MSTVEFGRVDEENNVYVQDGAERKVGQYPGVSKDEALAYFSRKFEDIAAQVRILEQRVANKVDAPGLRKIAAKLSEDLKEPAVVGNIPDLRRRVENLSGKITALTAEKSEAQKEEVTQAIAQRNEVATRAEELANQDSKKIQWKTSGAEMTALFEKWQALQKSGVKVPKKDADAIWKRFSSARTKFESAKRAYFAGLDSANKQTKAKKVNIVERAESLASAGSEDISAYRKLLDEWKLSGRVTGKVDDALWLRFKAAGDTIYAKKSITAAAESVTFEENLVAKLEVLKDAANIDPEKDLAAAKKSLSAMQVRWEKIGKVPKEKVRELDDKFKAIESRVKAVEQEQWRKTDPTTIDRTNSVSSQLEESILKLEKDLQAANASSDAKAIQKATEALEARKTWLEVVRATVA
jgi:hypothetical protein